MSLLALSGCVTLSVPNSVECAAAGLVTNGADCGSRISGVHTELTGDEYISFLNASATKPSAICESTADATNDLTYMEQSCAALKDQCTTDMQIMIANKRAILERRWDGLQSLGK